MKRASALMLALLLPGIPGRGAAQGAVRNYRFWGLVPGGQLRETVWRLPALLGPSESPNPGGRLTVMQAALPAPPRPAWRWSDVALASAFTTTLMLDAGQTRWLARDGWRVFREANPLLGPRPSVARVNVYTALAGLGVLSAAAALPDRLRPWFLGGAFAVEVVTVAGTTRQGVALRF
jgi:hypothetical protein